jgi:predicted lipoprotein with Yx(FWY)xxD motif
VKLRLVTALLLLLAACGGDSTESTTPAAPAETTEAPVETTAAPTTEAVASGQLVAVSASDLGDILVDGEGRTLYLFEPDAQGASTCYDSCESNWPPLVGGASAGDGVDGSLLGTASRDDGSEQVTYDGWPLYYFAGDAAAGDTNGQGINDVWYVVSAAGGAVEADAAAEAAGSAY